MNKKNKMKLYAVLTILTISSALPLNYIFEKTIYLNQLPATFMFCGITAWFFLMLFCAEAMAQKCPICKGYGRLNLNNRWQKLHALLHNNFSIFVKNPPGTKCKNCDGLGLIVFHRFYEKYTKNGGIKDNI